MWHPPGLPKQESHQAGMGQSQEQEDPLVPGLLLPSVSSPMKPADHVSLQALTWCQLVSQQQGVRALMPLGPHSWWGARLFVGIAQAPSSFLSSFLTLAWAQHLKQSGEQAALVGIAAFPQSAWCLLW